MSTTAAVQSTSAPSGPPPIVVIGGGFAGVECARRLSQRLGPNRRVLVFNRENYMVFQPLLPDVAGSSLNPRAITPPLRRLLRRCEVRSTDVLRIELAQQQIVFEGSDGSEQVQPFDHLVLACGSQVNMSLLPGMADHGMPLKTIGDAIAIRARVMHLLERADAVQTAEERRQHLQIVVVGGGFSGVEIAGELNDLIHSLRKDYPRIAADDWQVTLLHSQAKVLPEVSERLRDFAQHKMSEAGIRVRTEVRVSEITAHGVLLADGERVPGSLVVCTVGTAPNPLIGGLGLATERGRLVCDDDLRVKGQSKLWAIGDCALARNGHDGEPAPPTAQFAERMGTQCADNLIASLNQKPTRPFSFRPIGSACGIGGHRGVAEIRGVRFSGVVAFLLWRSTFLLKIPSLAQKLKVAIDWLWELMFARDPAYFRAQRSQAIGRAHFAPGEVILRRHELQNALYVLESGRARACRHIPGQPAHVWFELEVGSLIGQASLAEVGDADTVIEALEPCDVVIMGRSTLTKLSRALRPLQTLLERAVDRPKLRIWQHHTSAMQALHQLNVQSLPGGAELCAADSKEPLGQAFGRLIDRQAGCLLVTEQGVLRGVSTRTDLLAALARGADRDSPVEVAMNTQVRFIRDDASAAAAAEMMADHALKFLPVVDSAGRPSRVLAADDFVRFALARPRE